MADPVVKPRESYPYLVCRSNGKVPRFRFEHVGDAGVEAERQSRERPGATFIVMKEVARVTIPIPAASPALTEEPGDPAPRSPGSLFGERADEC